jgi:diadenosine tetraphosphate (Ap4A) HIT family hydrolase
MHLIYRAIKLFIVFSPVVLSLYSNASNTTVASTGQYDDNNPFVKILAKKLAADIVFENEHALAFHDIAPKAAVHVLVIPKGKYRSMVDFSVNASDDEIVSLVRALGATAKKMGVSESGFKLIANAGHDANQTVPHLHFHILGGEKLGCVSE